MEPGGTRWNPVEPWWNPVGTLVEPWWNPRGTLPQGRPGPPRSLAGLRPQSFRLLGKKKQKRAVCSREKKAPPPIAAREIAAGEVKPRNALGCFHITWGVRRGLRKVGGNCHGTVEHFHMKSKEFALYYPIWGDGGDGKGGPVLTTPTSRSEESGSAPFPLQKIEWLTEN